MTEDGPIGFFDLAHISRNLHTERGTALCVSRKCLYTPFGCKAYLQIRHMISCLVGRWTRYCDASIMTLWFFVFFNTYEEKKFNLRVNPDINDSSLRKIGLANTYTNAPYHTHQRAVLFFMVSATVRRIGAEWNEISLIRRIFGFNSG